VKLELAVFDIAGTTVDDGDAVNRCLRDALRSAGLYVTHDDVNTYMGVPKPVAIRALVAGGPLVDHANAIHADFIRRMTSYYVSDPAVRAVAGIGRLFASLREAGIKIALDTGFSRDITDAILRRLGWDGAQSPMDATITSDEVVHGRPHADMIERLMARLFVTTARAVAKVGDTPADLEEGMSAGCSQVIGVTWGTHTREQLGRFPHTHIVDSVDELKKVLLS
jgi:phosphonatase-like hydrolase